MNAQSPSPLDEGRRLLDSGDPEAAIGILEPLTRHPDPEVAGEAWVLTGTARYRIDDEADLPWTLRRDARSSVSYAIHYLRARKI